MYKNVQVVFTGAQGTGKTTMLNVFKDKFETVVTVQLSYIDKRTKTADHIRSPIA